MGGLFSSEPKVKPQNNLNERIQYNKYLYIEEERRLREYLNQQSRSSYSTNQVNRVSINRNVTPTYANRIRTASVVSPSSNISSRSRPSTIIISSENYKKYQQILCSAIIRNSAAINWSTDNISNANYRLIRLESWSPEYSNIESKFSRHRSVDITINKIERVENIYLLGQYFMKKLEYLNKGLPVNEKMMFHGTKRQNVDSICTNNFDWRYHGRTKGNIFGKGVSFTPKSSYANHYCDRQNKVMIVVKVLVSYTCEGNQHMVIPSYLNRQRLLRYDTSIKPGTNDVFVKYSDDEFYPAYLIHYTGKIFYPNKGFSR